MKKIMFLYLAICLAIAATAQDREERNTGNFKAIAIGVPADVYITKGKDHKVVLEGDTDDLENIETEVERGTLKIRNENYEWWGGNFFKKSIKIYITTPELSGVSLSGSGYVRSGDNFTADEFNTNISGSGKIALNINVNEIDINISGSGKIILTGGSKEADISISGSGDVEAEEFRISEADIDIMGSGNCKLHVTERINSRIMGSGNIYFAGDPKHVNNNSMGSGSIRKL